MSEKEKAVAGKSNYVSVYLPPRLRDRFEDNLSKVQKATNRSRNEVCRQILIQCLEALSKGDPRRSLKLTFNL